MPETPLRVHHRRLSAMYAAAPVNETIPCRVEVREGAATVHLTSSEAFWHAAGAMHGSLYFKALDDAAFFAASSVIEDTFVLTAHFEIELLAPVRTHALIAEGRLEEQEARSLTATAELFADGQLVARGRGAFVVSAISLADVPGYRDA